MIFSAYRACCCLGEICDQNTCCYKCGDPDCPDIPICSCYGVSCDDVIDVDRVCYCASNVGGDILQNAQQCNECTQFGFGIGCDPNCESRPGKDVLYIPIKCVECRYFDSNSPDIYDSRDITAGTPLLGETICRRAVPGVTAGTDFGSPNIGNDGTNWWPNGTGGIFENIPCEKLIFIGGTGHYLESINYCGCTGCATPEIFFGSTANYWEGNGTIVPVDVCGLSGW